MEKVKQLSSDLDSKAEELDKVRCTPVQDMWIHDLQVLEESLLESNRLHDLEYGAKRSTFVASSKKRSDSIAVKKKASPSNIPLKTKTI